MKAFLGAARVTALEPPTDKVTYIHQLLDKYATKVIPTSVGANAREQGDRSAGHHE